MNYEDIKNGKLLEQQMIRFKTDVIDQMTPEGSNTYIVGGVCRDILNGGEIHDIDIVTDHKDDLIQNLWEYCVKNGLQPSIHEMKRATIFKMDLPKQCQKSGDYQKRIDIEVSDYKPKEEIEGGDRDFTINAIYWPCGKGCDNSIPKLSFMYPTKPTSTTFLATNKVLTPVNDDCFTSNPVRIFRAADMISRPDPYLPYRPSAACYSMAEQSMDQIRKDVMIDGRDISGITEACLQILHKIFHDLAVGYRSWKDVRNTLCFLTDVGGWFLIHSDIYYMSFCRHKSSWHNDTVWQHTLQVLDGLERIRREGGIWFADQNEDCLEALYWAALLHDIGKVSTITFDPDGTTHFYEHHTKGAEIVKEIMRMAPLAVDVKRLIVKLVLHHMDTKMLHDDEIKPKDYYIIRRLMHDMGDESTIDLWIMLNSADCWASERTNKDFPGQKNVSDALWNIMIEHDKNPDKEPDWFRYKAPISGDEILLELQCDPCLVGEYLKQISDVAMKHPEDMMTKEQCIHYIHTLDEKWKETRLRKIKK